MKPKKETSKINELKQIKLPKNGEICLMRDYDDDRWKCKIFYYYDSTINNPFITDQGEAFKQLKRIKILD